MDSLRYWVSDMHVDGFRFDLAATLGREGDNRFDQLSAFFDLVAQDPVIGQAKLIAEPWDHQPRPAATTSGSSPRSGRSGTGRYRDAMRDFWRSRTSASPSSPQFGGSSDLYGAAVVATASVNLVTVHDGFTLRDLVSYNDKHNEANGEDNQDGTDDNRSWNCGAEGPSDDPDVNALQPRGPRAAVHAAMDRPAACCSAATRSAVHSTATLFADCRDNEISWIPTRRRPTPGRSRLREAITLRLRREHRVFQPRRFPAGRRGGGDCAGSAPLLCR